MNLILLAISSSLLLSLSFSTFDFSFFVWIGLVPLLFALQCLRPKQAFFIAYLCGFLFFAISMYWLIYVTVAGWILLSLYQALYFGIFGLAFSAFSFQLSAFSYLSLPSTWVILEYIRAHLAGGIGWNLLGYSQYKNLPIIQIADITGVWGVSFLIMLMNIAIYDTIKMAIKCYRTDSKFKIKTSPTFMQELKAHPVMQVFIVLVLFIAILTYGYLAIARSEIPSPSLRSGSEQAPQSQIKISVVQGNVKQMLKWDKDYKNEIMNRYRDLTIKASKDKPDLIIWPETAVPGYLNYDKELMQWIKRLIKRVKIPVLAGTPMISEEISDKSYNSAVLFSEKGAITGSYNKLHLVAFGEFIPFEKQLPFLRKLFPITGNFISGEEYTIFQLSAFSFQLSANFGTLICFEDIFPGLVRGFIRRGADFMVNISNDAWFGKTCAAYQHVACSVLRVVENRRPFIRSTNTGLSCFIDKTGKIYEKISKNGKDLFIQGLKTAFVEISKDETLTFYTKYGDIFVLGCFILLIVYIVGKISLTIK